MTDHPKPGPTPPIRALPAKSGGGLNRDDAEQRRRIVMDLLPYSRDAIRSADDLLEIAEYIEGERPNVG